MTDDELRAMVAGLQYPGNQDYDPISLEPLGNVTKKRAAIMETNLPELAAGGESLLDIGSSKGFIPFHLRDRYKTIVGVEQSHACGIAEEVRQRHGLDHIRFVNETFRQIPIGKAHRVGDPPITFEVVHCGSVHHHFVRDAIRHGAPMFLPLRKLVALARRYLILDGPFRFEHDTSLPKWEEEYGWGPEVRAAYTFDAHVEALQPQFELVHGPVVNERGRESAVFERVEPDIHQEHVTPNELEAIREQGTVVVANKAREKSSVIRLGGVRYKLDRGLQTDGVFQVLNSLPEWFAPTRSVLVHEGRRIGDVAGWVEGEPITRPKEIADHWLRLNDILASVGLVEIHFKQGDFVRRGEHVVDVDVDMVADLDKIAKAESYLGRWVMAGPAKGFGVGLAQWIAANLADEWVFQKAVVKLRKFRGK